MSALHIIELFAGTRPDGREVVEQLQVKVLDDNRYQLVKSPAFIHGLAAGDTIKLDPSKRHFELIEHSGNLAIRVFAKTELAAIANDLNPQMEKLGGQIDIENDRFLVYSIHVSCGFSVIEALLNDHIGEQNESAWFYGNVYQQQDGVTPLNWWQAILNQK